MDVWIAVIDPGTQDEAIVGVYTSEALALSVAERLSPEAVDATRFVLDEEADWIAEWEHENSAADQA